MKITTGLSCLALLLFVPYSTSACDLGLGKVEGTIDIETATSELVQILFATSAVIKPAPKPEVELVEDIDCYLLSQQAKLALISDFRAALTRAGRALHSAQNTLDQSMAVEGINANVNRDAGTGFVVFPNSSAGQTEVSLFEDLLAKHCSPAPSQKCTESLQLAKHLWWIAGQYRGFADSYNQLAKQKSLAFNQTRDMQWRSYKQDTIKLWPHEVAFNSLVYRPSQRGLSAPPAFKLMTLRPSLGLSYLSDQSHRIQPTVNVDLVGVYWWEYSNGAAQPGRGVSLSAIWDGDDTAYGLSYHHNPKWSLTVAQGDENDLVVSLSFQLAYGLLKR